MAAATVPAVEVRSTVGPRRQAVAPAARKAAPSSSVIPPSGPTTTSRSPDSARLTRPRLAVAPGARTIALAARAVPYRDAARRGPGHDTVHADLGHLLDGQLAPVPLGDGLDDGDRGVGAGHLAPGLHDELESSGSMLAGLVLADTVLADTVLADTVLADTVLAKGLHSRAGLAQRCQAQRPLNASRSLEKKPC